MTPSFGLYEIMLLCEWAIFRKLLHESGMAGSWTFFHVTCVICSSSHSIIRIGHSPPTFSSLQSQDHKPLFSACCTSPVELLIVFLTSLVHHHHPALLHRQSMMLDRLLTLLVTFSTLVLKLFLPSFSLSCAQAYLVEFDCSVFASWRP